MILYAANVGVDLGEVAGGGGEDPLVVVFGGEGGIN